MTITTSLVRTGLKAGTIFLGSVALGILAALLLGAGGAKLYSSLLDVGAATPRSGEGVLTWVFHQLGHPKAVIGFLFYLFIPIYVWLGFFYGGRRALASVVASHSGAVADRLAATVASRLASMPKLENAAGNIRQWINEDNVSQKMEAVVGSGKWARRFTRFATKRLPWNELLANWNAAAETRPEGESLQAVLSPRIACAINEAASPSWLPLGLCVGAQVALFVTGIWIL